MAFYSGFFNSKGLDRTYTAEDFTSYLSSIICDGILDTYGQSFKLRAASSGLGVLLGTGKAWIDGHYFINDAPYSINLGPYQDESLPRYVTISILLDVGESVRSVSLEVIAGTPAENPVLPALPSDENKTRLLMYAVRVNPDVTRLTEDDWTDYRDDKYKCGYCKCILGKCKVTDMQAQLAQILADMEQYQDSGTGQHTLGNAANICCYGQDGQPISSKVVCCKAQDIGFTGIANITAAYIYTHVDVRQNGKWYGDEVHGNNSVTDDFYKYFGGEDMKGIDVSVHNGNIDWNKVKADGIDFAILRAGYGKLASQKDEQFENNYAGAKAAGVPVGAYWFSYAKTVEEAKQEAEVFVSILASKQFEFPVYFDQEDEKTLATGKENCSAMVRAFCDVLEKAGYWVGLYTSRSCLSTHIEDDIKTRYALWIAEWGSKLNYSGNVGIWQYSEKGRVNGISGDVDLDTAYIDYTSKVKAKGLNGFGAIKPAPAPLDDKKTASVTVEVDGEVYKGILSRE